MTLGMVAAVAGIGIPIDGAIGTDLECRIAVLVHILAVLGFDRGWIAAAIGKSSLSGERRNGDHHNHKNGAH